MSQLAFLLGTVDTAAYLVADDPFLDLGFTVRRVEDSHATFRHAASDTILLFALYEPGEAVQPGDRVKVRRMLDDLPRVLRQG